MMEQELSSNAAGGFVMFMAIVLLFLSAATVVVKSCGEIEETRGHEWSRCYPNETCDRPMECYRKRCVVPTGLPEASSGGTP